MGNVRCHALDADSRRTKMKSDTKIEVETLSLLIVAYPARNVVLVSSKFGAFSHHMTCEEFCDAADRAVAYRREHNIP